MNTVTSVANVVRGSLSLQEVYDKIEQDGRKNSDRMIMPKNLRFQNGYMVSSTDAFPLTRHSAIQLATLADIPSKTFLWLKENASSQEFSDIVGRKWDKWANEQTKPMLFRLRKESEAARPRIRAILSSRYGMIDNTEFVRIMSDFLIRRYDNPKFSLCHVDGNGMHVTLQVPLTDQVELGGNDPHRLGVSLGQNEIGNGRWYIEANATRAACLNLAIWQSLFGAKSNGIHIGDAAGKLRRELESTFLNVIQRLPGVFDTYMNTRQIELEDPAASLKQLVLPNKLMTQAEVNSVINTTLPVYLTELGSNAYSVINSITEWVKQLEDQERVRVLQSLAGELSQKPAESWLVRS